MIVLSQNTQLGLAEYELNSHAISQHKLLLFSVRTSNELMSRMNEYREQRSRILVPRSRISFSRRVIATNEGMLTHTAPL